MNKFKEYWNKGTKQKVIVIVVIFFLIGGAFNAIFKPSVDDSTSTTKTAQKAKVKKTNEYLKFNLDEYKGDYVTCAEEVAAHYTDYDFKATKWEFADFDGKDDGYVMATYLDSVACVFEYNGKTVIGHYYVQNNTLHLDDGKCSATMKKLGLPTN